MKWYKNLYVGASLQGRERKIKTMLRLNRNVPFVQVITLPANPANLLDIIPASDLCRSFYPKDRLKVVGLAGDRDEAFALVEQIIGETYRATGSVRVEEYLHGRRTEEKRRAVE